MAATSAPTRRSAEAQYCPQKGQSTRWEKLPYCAGEGAVSYSANSAFQGEAFLQETQMENPHLTRFKYSGYKVFVRLFYSFRFLEV